MGHAAAEYDVHIGGLNSAILSGTRIFGDLSSVSAMLDFRWAPALLTANALFGQPFAKLSDILRQSGAAEVERLAWDRTGESYAATLSYSRPLNDSLQLNLDGTVLQLAGTPLRVVSRPHSPPASTTTRRRISSRPTSFGTGILSAAVCAMPSSNTTRAPCWKSTRATPLRRIGA